tara:strand:- start:59588 stop:60652 length:1065 start_codon:yes stop_codon:yes gene_type:complete
MSSRRHFLTGLLAAGIIPAPTWADVGDPAFLAAAGLPDGSFVLCGIDATLNVIFRIPLPARGHAAAAHPQKPEAVAFARRPGTFAVVMDCRNGASKAWLEAPQGRHFYGHGAFTKDGRTLLTTENDFENGQGRIGMWDATGGYARIGEFASGGIGPHDIKRLPGSDTFAVANGGIDTHPGSGRTKLNLPTMRPNLSYLRDGQIIETVELDADQHMNSIRHLAVAQDGSLALGMQWQGDDRPPPLVGLHHQGDPIRLMHAEAQTWDAMAGYVGSIAMFRDGSEIAVTSPRGGLVLRFDTASGVQTGRTARADVCGIAATDAGFIATTGTGALLNVTADLTPRQAPLMWDNHLIAI